MSTASAKPASTPPNVGGISRKLLVTIAVVTVLVWAFAIYTGSVVFMGIVGGLTVVVAGLLLWAYRLLAKQKRLASMLQSAADSPEARREALAKLAAGKDPNDPMNVFARAQLLVPDDPTKALETLESIELKKVPPNMQDDVAILRAQLYLHFGRPKDARPLADLVNLESPLRKDSRPLMTSVVAEAWARTGKHDEALVALAAVDVDQEPNVQLRAGLLVARVFARFAAGKRREAKADLQGLAGIDPNLLGRFVAPQYRVHPELQRLAREVAGKFVPRKIVRSPQRGTRPPR